MMGHIGLYADFTFSLFLLQYTQVCSSNGVWFIIRPYKFSEVTNNEVQ